MKISKDINSYFLVFILCMGINAFVFFTHFRVFYIPDLILLCYIIYKFKDLDQEIHPLFFVGVILLLGYLLFSPEPSDIDFKNKYLVTIKPFIYICILALFSKNAPSKSVYGFVRGVVVLYPFLLIWNIILYYIKHKPPISRVVQESRPFFMFENNFEITFYISCFIALVFIYKEKNLKYYFLLSMVILLANSRSGLLSFAAITPFYFWTLDTKKRWIALIAAIIAAGYVGISRNITQIAGNVDRLLTLDLVWQSYNKSFLEMLQQPFGFGIYEKVPTYLCIKLPEFAEWFVGNANNCDPLMLQAFYSRSLFQFGIYVTILIPIIYVLLLKKEVGLRLAILIIMPVACVAFSVGGFSNGIAFLGMLLSIYAYVQVNDHSSEKSNSK